MMHVDWPPMVDSGASGRPVLNCASASDVTAADSGGGGAGSAAGAGSVAGFTTAGFVSARNSDTGAPAAGADGAVGTGAAALASVKTKIGSDSTGWVAVGSVVGEGAK